MFHKIPRQEKNLEQLKSQLFQDSPVKNLRPKGEAWLEGVQPGTPPMLGTPGKERASSGAGSQSQAGVKEKSRRFMQWMQEILS